jgi:hypothetical protein
MHVAPGPVADPNFAPLQSENIVRIAAVRGQFMPVECKVLSVRENGATIYLNLGRCWTHDFTVTIPKRHRREFAAAGIWRIIQFEYTVGSNSTAVP